MMILILFATGCAKPQSTINTFCFYYEPPALTHKNIDNLQKYNPGVARYIDNMNETYKKVCFSRDGS